ncbi:hypothetical protein [Enterococcus cecorum]
MESLENLKTQYEENLQRLHREIQNQVNDKKAEIEEIKKKLEEIGADILIYKEKLNEAENELNADKYSEATKELEKQNILKEMYQKRLNRLENTPIIDRTEYDAMILKVEAVADKINEELIDEARKLLPQQFKPLADKAIEVDHLANEILLMIEKELGNNYEGYKMTAGGGMDSSRMNGLRYNYHRPFNFIYSNIEGEVNM